MKSASDPDAFSWTGEIRQDNNAPMILRVSIAFVCLLTCLHARGPVASQQVQVYFSPKGGCTDACVAAISRAKKTILVQAYSFTSLPIARALVAAHHRAVAVTVVLDKSQRSEKYSSADFVAHAGIATFIDAKHAIAHNKVMIIDGETVLTGSFNFTKSAEDNNAENLLIIRNPALTTEYLNNWAVHKEHSEPYEGR